jgi:hypothetical protein
LAIYILGRDLKKPVKGKNENYCGQREHVAIMAKYYNYGEQKVQCGIVTINYNYFDSDPKEQSSIHICEKIWYTVCTV